MPPYASSPELVYRYVCRFSQFCLVLLRSLLREETCIEWKAGPPSSLPFSAPVLHPAVALSRRVFFQTVETARTAENSAMFVPALSNGDVALPYAYLGVGLYLKP